MDNWEILITLLDQYGIPLVFVGLLATATFLLVKMLLKEIKERTVRSEDLVDNFKPSIDALTKAVQEHTTALKIHTEVVNALLAAVTSAERKRGS